MKSGLILITGPKHSGKSRTARALAKNTGGEAVDLDGIVEKQTGKRVRALFMEGPEIFRQAEARALATLIEPMESNIRFIAAGGGLVDNPQAMALLSQSKEIIIIYLDVTPETAWKRIQHAAADGELPPFLATENPRETHLALHERRAKAYKALAHFMVSAENKSPHEIALEIIEYTKLPASL